ncbi:diacylglycerol kinase [Microbacterium sp. NEAU-LLB]|uniref:Diacylglycerol kinase n=2 Tax=Microbacterium stercoris TaxID=2820289 RepID=A0A939QH46_9MICO|nr:diacylglycerol kinase [Microbacterium stercoris]
MVVNPAAGGGTAKEVGASFARTVVDAGCEIVGLSALSADVALSNVRGALRDIDALVVVGGDGMVHLGVQAVAQTDVPLGLIPVGTGNDFAAATGVPLVPADAIAAVMRRVVDGTAPRSLDLLRVEGAGVEGGAPRWVAGAVSAGLDAAVNARANRMRFPKGASKYVVAAVREILSYRSWGYRLQVEGVDLTPPLRAGLERFPGVMIESSAVAGEHHLRWESRGALVTAANTSTIGGGIRVAPDALLDDGLLDLILARDVGALTAGKLFPLMIAGKHLQSEDLRAVRARTVTMESSDAPADWPAVYGDGERIGTLPVRVEVAPGALRLLA